MALYTYITCATCKEPIMECKVFQKGIFLVAGVRCRVCGGEQFYCDNGFDPKQYTLTNPLDVQHEGQP